MEESREIPVADGAAPAGRSSLLTALRRRWWLAAGAVVVALAATTVLTVTATPTYRASVDVMVTPTLATRTVSDQYQASLTGITLATGYARLMSTTQVAGKVVDLLHLDESAATVRDRISASATTATNLITISVSDSKASRAAAVANAVPRALNAVLGALSPGRRAQASVTVVQAAGVPQSPAEPRPVTNYAIGLVLGVLVGVALAAAAERRRSAPYHAVHQDALAPAAPVGRPRRGQLAWSYGTNSAEVGE